MNIQVEEFVAIVEKYIDVNDVNVIYDVGAGSCEETVLLRNKFTNAEVYAFECNPACIHNCAKNIVNLDRITFIPVCVNDYTGLVKFHPINQEKTKTNRKVHPDGNPRASSVYLANDTYPHETYIQDEITIPCMKIRDIINTYYLKVPQVIWIDLQGAELAALKGMGDLSGVEIIHAEVAERVIYEGQCLFPEIKEYLEKKGFVCVTDIENLGKGWLFDDANFIRRDIYAGAE